MQPGTKTHTVFTIAGILSAVALVGQAVPELQALDWTAVLGPHAGAILGLAFAVLAIVMRAITGKTVAQAAAEDWRNKL